MTMIISASLILIPSLRAVYKTADFYFYRLHAVIAFELDQEGLALFAGENVVDEKEYELRFKT